MNKYLWLALIVGLALGIGGWLLLAPKQAKAPQTSNTASSTATTTNVDLTQLSTTSPTHVGGYTITPVPATGSTVAMPDYTAQIKYSANISADVKTAIETQRGLAIIALNKNKDDYQTWLALGTLHKIAGDYSGAATIWTYVSKHWVDAVSLGNLGDLYLNFTHEYAKAAAAYQSALKIKPGNADYEAGLKAAQQAEANS